MRELKAVAGPRKPSVKRENRAHGTFCKGNSDLSAFSFLVSLAPTQVDDDPLGNVFYVGNVNLNEFRASEGSRKTDEQKGAVTQVLQAIA